MTCPTCDQGICTQGCAKGTRPRRRASQLIDKNRPALQQFNNTALMLMMQFGGPVVEPKTVANHFGFKSPVEANRAYNDGTLPVPAFRQRDSQKAPLMVHVEDLARHIDNQRQQAADEMASWTTRAA